MAGLLRVSAWSQSFQVPSFWLDDVLGDSFDLGSHLPDRRHAVCMLALGLQERSRLLGLVVPAVRAGLAQRPCSGVQGLSGAHVEGEQIGPVGSVNIDRGQLHFTSSAKSDSRSLGSIPAKLFAILPS